MRQIAMALLMYIDTNKGKMPPATINAVDEEDAAASAAFGPGNEHEYPTALGNNGYTIANDGQGSRDGLSIASWYMLNCRTANNTSAIARAWTNMAFFDGHVTLYPSARFQAPQNMMDRQFAEVIFYVNRQVR